ncbi:MAG: rhodanese-like domain-containing protein [Bacteroidales bacterium]|nr:rhodanese-like domain-containing protein [Bacteroidales bacterium]
MGTKIIGVIVLFLVVLNIHAQNITEVQSSKVNDMLKTDKGWVVLDVRTPQEFSQGHLPGALNIDIYQNNALEKISKLNKDAKYIVYCRTRNRSGVVSDFMIQKGFKTVYQMVDGIAGWNQVKGKE